MYGVGMAKCNHIKDLQAMGSEQLEPMGWKCLQDHGHCSSSGGTPVGKLRLTCHTHTESTQVSNLSSLSDMEMDNSMDNYQYQLFQPIKT